MWFRFGGRRKKWRCLARCGVGRVLGSCGGGEMGCRVEVCAYADDAIRMSGQRVRVREWVGVCMGGEL